MDDRVIETAGDPDNSEGDKDDSLTEMDTLLSHFVAGLSLRLWVVCLPVRLPEDRLMGQLGIRTGGGDSGTSAARHPGPAYAP